MTVTANNPALYNAAFAGALAGQLAAAGITGIPATDDSVPPLTVYGAAANNASEFAYQFDQVAFTTPVTNLSSGNATVPPTTAAEAATTSRPNTEQLGRDRRSSRLTSHATIARSASRARSWLPVSACKKLPGPNPDPARS